MADSNKVKSKILTWVPSIVWALIILVFAVIKFDAGVLSKVTNIDKMVHFLEYLLLAFLVVRVFLHEEVLELQRIVLFTLILCGGYGILIELVQHFIPTREASLYDILFNFIGVFAGIIIGKLNHGRNKTV